MRMISPIVSRVLSLVVYAGLWFLVSVQLGIVYEDVDLRQDVELPRSWLARVELFAWSCASLLTFVLALDTLSRLVWSTTP